MKKELLTIVNCATYAMNELAKYSDYDGWSGQFCKEEAKKAMGKIRDELKKIDHKQLSTEEALIARFGKWTETTLLCPLYYQPLLKPDADNDERYGCVADGWEISGHEIKWDVKKDLFSDEEKKESQKK